MNNVLISKIKIEKNTIKLLIIFIRVNLLKIYKQINYL